MPDLHDLFARAVDDVPDFDATGLRRVVSRRRRRRLIVAAAAVAAVVTTGTVVIAARRPDHRVLIAPPSGGTTTSSPTPSSSPSTTTLAAPNGPLGYPVVEVHPEAFRGFGKVAYPSDGALVVLDGTGAPPHSIPLPAPLEQVRWSPDGEWLAIRTRSGPDTAGGQPVDLFVVRADATTLTRLPVSGSLGEWAWSPTRAVLAVGQGSSTGTGSVVLFAAPDFTAPIATAITGDLLAWSPDDARLVVKTYTPQTSFVDQLWSVDISSCPPACDAAPREIPVTVHLPPNSDMGFNFAGWSSDGKRLLIWLDAAHSGSILMDGLEVASIALDGSPQAQLPGMLAKPSWIADVNGTDKAVIAVGGFRIWDSHRQLDSCNLASGACTTLVENPGPTIDPAVSPDGQRLAYVATDKVVFANNNELPPKSSIRWTRSRRLVVAGIDNQDPQVVASNGVVAPRWASDSRHLVFWRSGYLLLVDVDHPEPVAIAGQLEPRPDGFGFGPFAHYAYILPGDEVWDTVAWLR